MKTRKLLSQGARAICARLIGIGLNLVVSILLSRSYGLSAVGVWSLGAAAGMVVGYIGAFGLNASTTKLVASCLALNQELRIRRAVDLALFTALAGAGTMAIAAYWLARKAEPSLIPSASSFSLLCIFLGTVLGKASATSICALQGVRRSWESIALDVIPIPLLTLIAYVTNWAAYREIPSFDDFSLIWLLVSIAVVLVRRAYWNQCLSRIEKETLATEPRHPPYTLKELLRISWPFYIGSIVFMSLNQVDTLLMGILSTPEEIGGYSIAFRLAALLAIFQSVTDAFTTPRLAEHAAVKNYRKMVEVASKSSSIILAMALPAAAVYILLGHQILAIWGEETTKFYAPLILLTLGQLINVGSGPSGRLLLYSDHGGLRNAIACSALALDVVLNYLLISKYGALGAASATSISLLYMYFLFWLNAGIKLGHFAIPRFRHLIDLTRRA